MLLPLRYPRVWLALGWFLVVSAVVVSLMPGQALPHVGVSDKFQHSLAYTVLTLWFAGIYPRSAYAWIAVGMLLLGITIEWAQGSMHLGRMQEARDVAANTLGVAIGMAVALLGVGGWAQRVEGWLLRA